MYKNSKALLEILKSFLFETEYKKPVDLDIDNIIKIAEIHSVTAMVGAVFEKAGVEVSPLMQTVILKRKIQCATLGAQRELFFNEISRGLTENDIENIIVKGYVLRDLYPIKDLRTMTDMDFVIKSSDGNKMEKVMLRLGYELGEVFQGDWSFFKNKVHIEFHEKLTESDLGNGYNYDEYLRDCFDHTVEYNGLTRTLDNEYHLIYMLIHCAKHFYNGGCGFRMIMDFAAYLKKYNNDIDWRYINGELKKIRLYDFSENIWYLCGEWFGITAENKVFSMDASLYNEVFGFVAKGGTFGEAEGEARMVNKAVRESIEKNSGNAITSLWIKLRRYIFLDDKSMRGIIPWYKNKPKIMLPVAWMYKGITAISKKGFGITKDIIVSSTGDEKAIKEYNMLKGLGLYKKK